MSRDTRLTLGVFCALGVLLLLHSLLFFPWRVDDAFILVRYAQNLAEGQGAVFNPGERVEGFTSPAMVGLEAVLLRAGVEPLEAVKVLGLGWGLVLLGATLALTRELSGSRVAAGLAGLLVALHPGVAVACINGLETAPFAALVALGLALHVRARSARDEGLAGGALALALLFRIEAALPLAFIGVSALVRWRHAPDRWRRWLALALPTLVLVVPVVVFKALWFGSLTPNTLLAKVPRDATGRLASGLDYLAQYGTAQQGYFALLALWALAFKADRRFLLLASLATVWAGYVASVGGDWMPHFRFLVPLVPLACAAMGTALVFLWRLLGERLAEGRRPLARAGLVLLALGALLPGTFLQLPELLQEIHDSTRASVRAREPLAHWLRAQGGPHASVAMLDVGAVAALSGLRVIDTGGLTDARVARLLHESQGSYRGYLFGPDARGAEAIARRVLEDRPSFVVLLLDGELPWLLEKRPVAGGQPLPFIAAYQQDRAFFEAPGFGAQYQYLCSVASERSAEGWVWHYNVFARKELALPPVREDARGSTRCF